MLSRIGQTKKAFTISGSERCVFYCVYFFISEETNRREILVEDLVSTLASIVQRDLCHVRS
jgi:hypothetical protein